jgi:hypothetical protein
MRIFDNTHHLRKSAIERRLQALDAEATASPYIYEDIPTRRTAYYVGVDSETLTDKQIEGCLGSMMATDVAAEQAALAQADWLKTAKAEVDALKTQLVTETAELTTAKNDIAALKTKVGVSTK